MKKTNILLLLLTTINIFYVNSVVYPALPNNNVAYRIDDVQDFWVRDEQIALLNLFIITNTSLTVGMVSGSIGDDYEIVETLQKGYGKNLFEFAYHGFGNENHSQMNYSEQKELIMKGLERMKKVFGKIELVTFIPPMHMSNQDTIKVCAELDFKIISSTDHYDPPPWEASLKHFPQTVESAYYVNGRWIEVDLDNLQEMLQESVKSYGFAVITIHPQQFSIFDEKNRTIGLNTTKIDAFSEFLNKTKRSFNITTIAGLGGYEWKAHAQPGYRPNIFIIAPIIFFPSILVAVVFYVRRKYLDSRVQSS